ncbi:MAG: hypothetical protein LUH04_06890 [Clostridium sp.]|nr:hypothetical protein [Clostridium sp.]
MISEKKDQMKPLLYVHMGVAKTGSTALQSFLAKNMPLLEKNGILYPIPDGNPINRRKWVGNAYTFACSFMDRTYDARTVRNIAKQMGDEARRANKNALLSCEGFAEFSERQDVEFFCATMGAHFNLVLITYVRNPLDWYFSKWKQMVKNEPEIRPFKEFMENFQVQWTHISTWLNHAAEVHVLSFDEHKKDLLTPFLSALGVKPPTAPAKGLGHLLTIDNRSLTDSELAFFLAFNQNPALAGRSELRWKINSYFLLKNPTAASHSLPDPALAPLAEARHEEFFKAVEPYLPREKIIRSRNLDPSLKLFDQAGSIDRSDVVIALKAVNDFLKSE